MQSYYTREICASVALSAPPSNSSLPWRSLPVHLSCSHLITPVEWLTDSLTHGAVRFPKELRGLFSCSLHILLMYSVDDGGSMASASSTHCSLCHFLHLHSVNGHLRFYISLQPFCSFLPPLPPNHLLLADI